MPDTFAQRLLKVIDGKPIPHAARDLGYPTETLRSWLHGHKPALDTFFELSIRTNKSPVWLYDGTGPEDLKKFNRLLKRNVTEARA